MSKVNIAKVAKDVGICSESLVSISESLSSISEKVATVARAVAGIVSEFRGGSEKDVAGEKTAKQAGDKPEPKPEDMVKEYTFIEVRTFLAERSRAGHTAEVKKILAAHGADKLSDLDKAEYAAVMAEAEVLG